MSLCSAYLEHRSGLERSNLNPLRLCPMSNVACVLQYLQS